MTRTFPGCRSAWKKPSSKIGFTSLRTGTSSERRSRLFARTDKVEITPNVKPISARNVVFVERLFGHGVILAIHFRVAPRGESLFRRAADDLATAGALSGVGTRYFGVLRAHLGVGRGALHVPV